MFTLPSVRVLCALASFLFLTAFAPFPPALQGRWQCDTRSGNAGQNVSYTFNCDGALVLHADRSVESTCEDVFFPPGTRWRQQDAILIIEDSGGQEFIRYAIKALDAEKLVLERKAVVYTFIR
jgi:hypothetical protein